MTIKWKRTTLVGQAQAPTSEELERVTSAAGIKFTVLRDRGYGRIVFQLPQPISLVEAEAIAARIRALPEIEYVVPGVRGRLGATPNDTWFEPRQWNLRAGIAGINAQSAWDYVSASDPSTVVAVIDSGVLPGHEDIAGRVVTGNPAGYDFISNATIANDGDGRDANPADPGSWVSSAEAGTPPFAQCAQEDSIWHGTLVAGIIGATPNNAKGIAGIGWNARLLPVRAFGKGSLKCSTGSLEDVGDAIAWSIGHALLTGEPINPNPARVINMSFGFPIACDVGTQTDVDLAYKRRTVLVASAGNNGETTGFVDLPANCNRGIYRTEERFSPFC